MKILLADDHALFRDGLVMILNALFPETDLYQAGTWGEVHSTLKRHPVDLALVDLSMPGSWQGELPELCQQYPTVKFCVLSATTTPEVIQAAFQLGIKGYITKLTDMNEMEAAPTENDGGRHLFSAGIMVCAANPFTHQCPITVDPSAAGHCFPVGARQPQQADRFGTRHQREYSQASYLRPLSGTELPQ